MSNRIYSKDSTKEAGLHGTSKSSFFFAYVRKQWIFDYFSGQIY